VSERRPGAVRVYGALLAFLAPDLRGDFAREATELFAELYRSARRERGRLAAAGVWAASVAALARNAVEARGEPARHGGPVAPRLSENGRVGEGDKMDTLIKSLRHAARSLLTRPGFSLTATLLLATGIGATTTIFSVVDTVVLRPLPYPGAGSLVHFDNGSHPYPNFESWRGMSSFEVVSAARDYEVDLTGVGQPERIPAVAVSPEFFRMFGGAPHLGRLFGPTDYPGDRSVSVLSHGLWTRLGADPNVVGSTLRIDGRATTVVGILDAGFVPPSLETGSRVDLWFPLDDGGDDSGDHGYHVLGVAGRLAPGVSLAAAQAEVDAERAVTAEAFPSHYVRRDGTLELTPLVEMRHATVRYVSRTLYLLLGAVVMMLLIACANVANLFLARGTARAREIALRGALGASRMRLVGQVMTESVVLATVGGALGIVLAFGGVELFTLLTPGGIPRLDGLSVDGRVLTFSIAISAFTGVVFGSVPALQAVRANMSDVLKDGAAAVTASRGGRRLRSGLVVAEVALAVVLVAGAGLLFRSFVARVQVDPGFETERLAILSLSLEANYDPSERAAFVAELFEQVRALPGTGELAAGWTIPFTMTGGSRCCWRTRVVGDPALQDEENPFLSIIHPVTAGYFEALEAPVTGGRAFTDADDRPDSEAVVINRVAARALFGESDPLGQPIRVRDDVLTVVGVVEGVHHWGLDQHVEQAIYVPYARYGTDGDRLNVLVRTERPLDAVAAELRGAVWAIDPDLTIERITSMNDLVAGSVATPRFLSALLATFAVIALLLACGGIYGSTLYSVGQRRREMGVRLALGASANDVFGLVLRYGSLLGGLGVVLGTLTGIALSRFMQTLVWGVAPTDPVTYFGSAGVIGLAAVAASLVPAWRAGRTDPLQTLKAE
jgi:putative ABC transport system permease protein